MVEFEQSVACRTGERHIWRCIDWDLGLVLPNRWSAARVPVARHQLIPHWNATTSHPNDFGSIVLPRDFGHFLLQMPSEILQIAKKLDNVAALRQIDLEHQTTRQQLATCCTQLPIRQRSWTSTPRSLCEQLPRSAIKSSREGSTKKPRSSGMLTSWLLTASRAA